ncbi:MAG: hypothetical protein Q8R13_03295, partial [bacterium]|nr:hypothetical protein [bacterium]MDZ4284969.1 methyltransferase C-terminal domain-containing protein [Patescibacteria group bacterium]
SPISGGAIVVYARKTRVRAKAVVARYRSRERALQANTFRAWQRFARRAFAHAVAFRKLLEKVNKDGDRVVGYGAGDRGVTLLNVAGVTPRLISVIADRNTLKQGYAIGGAKIPIESPEKVMAQHPDTVVLVAWNFAEEIKGYLKEELGYRGKFIQPLPGMPRLLKS